MPMKQLLVIIVCLVAGYLIVSAVMSPAAGSRKGGKGTDKPAGDSSGDAPGERSRGDSVHRDSDTRDEPASSMTGDVTVTLSNWYRILGVRENASREEIAAGYKKMISQYHPDKVAQMGPDIRAVAEAKTKQINAAYDLAMRIYR